MLKSGMFAENLKPFIIPKQYISHTGNKESAVAGVIRYMIYEMRFRIYPRM
jgi:hypothetical protein